MKFNSTHSIAVSWANNLNRRVNKEGIDFQKMVLGLEILLHNIPKLILVVVVAAGLGILLQSLITMATFACLRRYIGGLHAKNGIRCTIMSLVMFVAIPFSMQAVYIDRITLSIFFLLSSLVLYGYSPADTESRPIIGKIKRKRLKIKSITACFFLFLTALVLQNKAFYVLIVLGVTYGVIAILPITYTILGRSVNNYEKHEGSISNESR